MSPVCNDNLFLTSSVMTGRYPLKPQKLLGKIAGVVVSHSRGNLLNLQIGVFKQSGCLIGPLLVDKINKGHTHFVVKQGRQIVGIHREGIGSVFYRQVICQMFLDVGDRQIHQGF